MELGKGLNLLEFRDLRLFCFNKLTPTGIVFVSIPSHDLEDAIAKVKSGSPDFNASYLGSIRVKDVIDLVETKEEKPEMSKESFINGLKLTLDRFISDEKDRSSLSEILGKIS